MDADRIEPKMRTSKNSTVASRQNVYGLVCDRALLPRVHNHTGGETAATAATNSAHGWTHFTDGLWIPENNV